MPFTYQWTRDGKDIPGAVGDTYRANPATDGGHTIYFRVVGSGAGGSTTATSPGVFIPAVGPALTISGTPSSSGIVGSAYSFTPTTSGGTAPYTYSIPTGSLPAGLSLNAQTGAITGTPTTPQVKSGIVLMVTDHAGATASLPAFLITIAAAGQGVTPSTWLAALQAAAPGTILTMAPGDYGTMNIYNVSKAAPGVVLQGQAGVTCTGADLEGASGITITGWTFGTGGITVQSSDRIVVDRMVTPGNNPGTIHTGNGVWLRNNTNISITNNTFTQLSGGVAGLDCSNVTISGNHITKISDNFIFLVSFHSTIIEKNYLANIDFIDGGTHPDTIQLASTGDTGRCNNITVRYNNYDAMSGTSAQGIAFCEDVDDLTITGNCTFGAQYNGCAVARCNRVSITDNFVQGWTYSPGILARGASDTVNMTGNWCAGTPYTIENCTNVTIGPNTLIPNATSSSDTALRNTWLTSHPLVPTS